jgi:hypothetical protein
MIQIDGPRRQVCIKFKEFAYIQELLQTNNGQSDYKHTNGEISQVLVEMT